jgi:hypothetical protein
MHHHTQNSGIIVMHHHTQNSECKTLEIYEVGVFHIPKVLGVYLLHVPKSLLYLRRQVLS